MHLAVAPIEPEFYRAFLQKMGLDGGRWLESGYPAHSALTVERDWPELKRQLADIFKSRTRDEWCALLGDGDMCVTPVLTLQEAALHAHNRARSAFIDVGGVQQNAPAPRFSRTSPAPPTAPAKTGADLQTVLADWGIDSDMTGGGNDAISDI